MSSNSRERMPISSPRSSVSFAVKSSFLPIQTAWFVSLDSGDRTVLWIRPVRTSSSRRPEITVEIRAYSSDVLPVFVTSRATLARSRRAELRWMSGKVTKAWRTSSEAGRTTGPGRSGDLVEDFGVDADERAAVEGPEVEVDPRALGQLVVQVLSHEAAQHDPTPRLRRLVAGGDLARAHEQGLVLVLPDSVGLDARAVHEPAAAVEQGMGGHPLLAREVAHLDLEAAVGDRRCD